MLAEEAIGRSGIKQNRNFVHPAVPPGIAAVDPNNLDMLLPCNVQLDFSTLSLRIAGYC